MIDINLMMTIMAAILLSASILVVVRTAYNFLFGCTHSRAKEVFEPSDIKST